MGPTFALLVIIILIAVVAGLAVTAYTNREKEAATPAYTPLPRPIPQLPRWDDNYGEWHEPWRAVTEYEGRFYALTLNPDTRGKWDVVLRSGSSPEKINTVIRQHPGLSKEAADRRFNDYYGALALELQEEEQFSDTIDQSTTYSISGESEPRAN